MANQDDENKVIKKVQPYPFPVAIQRDGKIINAQVLKLAQKGAIIGSNELIFSVGAELQVFFEIPVHKVAMSLLAKVIKTYDRALPQGRGIERLAEVHFTNISSDQIRSIYKFLVAIRQVRP